MVLQQRYARLHFVSFVVFAAKTAARLRTYFYVPPKLAHLRYLSKLQTVRQLRQGWRGVKSQRHLNEGTAENIIFTNNIYMGASAEISPRAPLGRNDVIYLLGRNDVI